MKKDSTSHLNYLIGYGFTSAKNYSVKVVRKKKKKKAADLQLKVFIWKSYVFVVWLHQGVLTSDYTRDEVSRPISVMRN